MISYYTYIQLRNVHKTRHVGCRNISKVVNRYNESKATVSIG